MDSIYVKSLPLRALRGKIESGVFAIPELQREFVWNARKACDLLDSIHRNYPIGTILVWKTSRKNEGELRKKLHILPPFNPANRDIFFLIDGQQRLSVLWHLLRGEAFSVKNADGQEIDFAKVYFNPHAEDGEPRFIYRKRVTGDLADDVVSVVDMLSGGWRRRLRRHGVRALRRIEECRARIFAYRAHLIFCETNGLPEVRETFVRINSLGMRIGTADRAFARASKLDLRGRVKDAQARLQHGFNRVSSETILQTIALALGARDLGERAIDSMISRLERNPKERARFDKDWPVLREALASAADYLVHVLGVPNFDFLPSEPMITVLALFFFHNYNARPSAAARAQLQRWFWSTAVGARYTGRGYRPNILKDSEFVERLTDNVRAKGSFTVRIPIHTLRSTEYGRPGPLSNAFFCLLRKHRPRYLQDGMEIPAGEISSRRNRSDKHHIFPRALLSRHGIGPDKFNSIVNICYLVARENQSVGQRAPRTYFEEVPRNGRARALAVRSHLIPSDVARGIWDRSIKRGFKTFLADRAQLLVRAFEEQAGVRLFERT